LDVVVQWILQGDKSMSEEQAVQPDVKVVEVKSAGDWSPEVKGTFVLSIPGRKLTFKLRALTFGERMATEAGSPMPPTPTLSQDDPDYAKVMDAYENAMAEAGFQWRVATLDLCWSALPGETLSAKSAWAGEKLCRDGEILSVYDAITRLSGYGRCREIASTIVDSDASPEAWADASAAPLTFEIEREGLLLHFAVHSLSRATMKSIESATEPPVIPIVWRKDASGKPYQKRDANDPKYLEACRIQEERRRRLVLEKALGFEIKELDALPAWEVAALFDFCSNTAQGYRPRADFF
jgi:hypothetical protein